MQPLRTIKITQPLGTKKNQATSQDKQKSCNFFRQKNHATSGDNKNIMQPLGEKKFGILSGHTKIKEHLGTNKNHATLQQENFHTTSRTKKSHNQKHAISQDKKKSCAQ